jgi:restriction endonuclease Mrr
MITAEQAREIASKVKIEDALEKRTEEKLKGVYALIKEQAEAGLFHLETVVNPFQVGQRVVEILKKQGFQVKGMDNLTISW